MTDYSRYYYSYSLLYRVPVFGVVHEDRGGGRIPPPNNDTVSTPMLTTTRTTVLCQQDMLILFVLMVPVRPEAPEHHAVSPATV